MPCGRRRPCWCSDGLPEALQGFLVVGATLEQASDSVEGKRDTVLVARVSPQRQELPVVVESLAFAPLLGHSLSLSPRPARRLLLIASVP